MVGVSDTNGESIVFVIDDDTSVRGALKDLFESVSLKAIPFASAAEFLRYKKIPDKSCCMVLDVRMPEMSGLKLQEELAKAGIQVPIVFLTGQGDIEMAVETMKAGAVDFIVKPFRTQHLLDAVFAALQRDRARRIQQESVVTLRERFSLLSAREGSALVSDSWEVEQANSARLGHQRNNGKGASRKRIAKNARKLCGRACQND
jgi:FixJ family two-component response regulator